MKSMKLKSGRTYPSMMRAATLALLLLMTVAAFAQPGGDRKQEKNKMAQLTPEQRNELHLKKMTLALDLNASQQKEMAKIIAENQSKRSAMIAEMKARREKGQKLAADERFALQNKQLDEKLAMKERMKKLLNKEQFDKWEKMKEHKRREFNGKRKQHGEKRPVPQD